MENSTNTPKGEKQQEDLVSENQEEVQLEQDNVTEETGQPTEGGDEEGNELNKAQADLAEVKDKYLRLYSEFENYRRRTSKEKLEMIQTANEQLIKSLLPVLDDFERAEKALGEAATKEQEGFILIYSKLKKIVEQNGVKAMDLKQGSDFDADTQEAITQLPAPEEKLKGKIIDVVEKGYLLNDKVIRYAKVVVGN